MTSTDLHDALITGAQWLTSGFRTLTKRDMVDVVLEFPDRSGAVDRYAELRFAARLLKKSSHCNTALVINDCAVRISGVRSHLLPALLTLSSELGAARWKLLA